MGSAKFGAKKQAALGFSLSIRAKLGLFFLRDSARWADSAAES
jgi:hypothetical protein